MVFLLRHTPSSPGPRVAISQGTCFHPDRLQDLRGCRVSRACRLSGWIRVTSPLCHHMHANRTYGPPCPSSCVCSLMLSRMPTPSLLNSTYPRRLWRSPSGSPSWFFSRKGSLPRLHTTAWLRRLRPFPTVTPSWCLPREELLQHLPTSVREYRFRLSPTAAPI